MNEHLTLERLRGFLRGLTVALFCGTVLELILAGHTDGLMQWVPFLLCGLGLVVMSVAWLRPGRGMVFVLRAVMVVVACGSLLGVSQHFLGNRAFAQETNPQGSAGETLNRSLTGADPLLAPGILAVAAVLAIASTYAVRDREPAAVAETEREAIAVL